MDYSWRTSLTKYIEDNYIQKQEEWFDFDLSPSGLLNMTIVSERFASQPLEQRREQIRSMIHEIQAPPTTGFLTLYTPEEAESIGLSKPSYSGGNPLYTWLDLAQQAANPSESQRTPKRGLRVPRTITFYSFKGGVGRTTALTHVAAILAMRGRKVVAVDLDLEAPGLSPALSLTPSPEYGIVDYFYERAYLPQGEEPTISIAEIFGEVRIPDAPGRLFVVPAGKLSLDYIAKVDDLRANVVTENGEDLWSIFYREITEQLQPDIILIDSRTGINEWGAFSLLRAADKAIVFLYPNEQNKQGIKLLLEALVGKVSLQLVFSPIPFGEAGSNKVQDHWLALRDNINNDTDPEYLEDGEDTQSVFAEPLTVQYLSEIALASNYPVRTLLSHYMDIANVVDEDTTAINLSAVLTDTDRRWKIVESLRFPEVDATTNQNLSDLFQRTADFDRFLNDTTCLIRGRKGTGKSALYWLLLKHSDVARQLSQKRLDSVTCLSGHGRFRGRPTRNEFQYIDEFITEHKGSWEAFWRGYLLLQMQREAMLSTLPKGNTRSRFSQLYTLLRTAPGKAEGWQMSHTDILKEIATDKAMNLVAKDALDSINEQLQKEERVLWFLYDDLDEDLPEKDGIRERALTGLFQFIQACDARRLRAIGLKIFLREDIWNRIIFDNKSHFNGRDIILQWTRIDFLRLALRQARQSSEFQDVVDRFAPIENIDQADEVAIDQALQLLWGSRREQNLKSKYVSRWVYERLTDSSGTTFPRSLNILLKEARDYELDTFRGQSSPTDRFLRPKSLNQGLIRASEQRCQEIREEYQELRSFFDAIVNSAILISTNDLRDLWQKNIQQQVSEFKEFRKFVDFLLSIGLIGTAELGGKERGYRFAEIYTHGFKLYRGPRKY